MKRARLCGVYVHLPFCDVKCAYCDFYSLANRHVDETFWRRYLDRLLEDLARQFVYLKEDTFSPVLASIFFGGGTPSKAPGFVIARVIQAVKEIFPKSIPAIEISAEANPESLTEAVLSDWRIAGVNRISVGMQSLDEGVLKYLGRLYNASAYREVLNSVRRAGFENFNSDFITGVPGQSVASTLDDLKFALGEGVSHLSLYQLTVETGTLLKQRIEAKTQVRPNDAQQVRQMDAAIQYLEEQNFTRYEISNFTRGNRTCLHNLIYWTGRPYLGLGVSAHGFTGQRRFFHARSLEKYLAGNPGEEDAGASQRDQLINLLRLKRTFHQNRVLRLFSEGAARRSAMHLLERARDKAWLSRNKNTYAPTHLGLKYTDSLLTELWRL